jgi:hypothetical protein
MTTYHSYHAMMIVAAALLTERPVRLRSYDRVNEFDDWLTRFSLTRTDGRWISDRRSPQLCEAESSVAKGEPDWLWNVTAETLDKQLWSDKGQRVLWGTWQHWHNGRRQTVSVRSALVSVRDATEVLKALQTAEDFSRHALPSYDVAVANSDKIHGWVVIDSVELCLDQYDPWAQGLHFPGPSPSKETVTKLGLVPHDDGNKWRNSIGGEIHAEIWTQLTTISNSEESVPGNWLIANPSLVQQLLRAHPDCLMILSVEINRRPSEHERDSDGSVRYPKSYTRYYLMGAYGVTCTF